MYSDCGLLQACIQYMKFGRRAEGIKSGRQVFKLARENPKTTYHVYVAAALMEYYCSKVSGNLITAKLFGWQKMVK